LLSSNLYEKRITATIRAFNLYDANSEVSAVQVTSDWDVYVTQESHPSINAFAYGICAPAPAPPLADPIQYGGSSSGHTRWCRPQWIIWNISSDSWQKVNSTAKYNYVGCHEVGHTLGLRHRSAGSCMYSPPLGPNDPGSSVPTTENPTSGDYDRIDRHYPL